MTCETCKHYHMLDSAYGECRRFPPQYFSKQINIFKHIVDVAYPEIAFDNEICAEYSNREEI